MAVGDIITAARYNAIQKAIAAVQGPGGTNPVTNISDDTFGYGQTLVSSQVEQFAKVTAQDMINLRQDLVRARQHQTGQSWASLLTTNPEFLEVINESIKIGDAHTVKYETAATSAITNRLLLGESPIPQFSIETFADPLINGFPRGIRARRTETWRTSLTHEIFADFADYNRARYFFNAGGQIIITPFLGDVPNNANTKTFEWRTLLNTIIKDIRFGYNYSTSTGTGATTNAIGFYQLTTTFQEIFRKSSNPTYSENYYVINARFTNSNRNTILFEIKFVDDHVSRTVPAVDPVTGVNFDFTNPDEDIVGTLNSEASQRRATGTNVETLGPTFRNGITI